MNARRRPLTSHRFTLNHQGAMLGWEMSPDQLGEHRPALNGMLKNLYFVGHWTQPGGGITPVIVSAMQVARKIAGKPEFGNAFSVNPWVKSANIRGVFSEL